MASFIHSSVGWLSGVGGVAGGLVVWWSVSFLHEYTVKPWKLPEAIVWWSGGLVVWWSGGLVIWWSGGSAARARACEVATNPSLIAAPLMLCNVYVTTRPPDSFWL